MRLQIMLFLFVCSQTSFANKAPLLINSPDWLPYFTYDDKAGGYAKELLKHLLNDNGYVYSFVPLPIERGNQYIKTGKLDISVLSYKPEREHFVHYANFPLFTIPLKFVSRPEHANIQSVKEIKPLRFEYVRGVSYTKEIREQANKNEKDAHTSVTLEHALKKIIANRSDITAASTHSIISVLKSLGYPNTLEMGAFVIKEKVYYITISKNSKNITEPTVFFEKMRESLHKAEQTGFTKYLSVKYHLSIE